MQVPIMSRISQWEKGTEIIYCCPNCGTSFAFFGHTNQKFCHNCGQKNNWENLPVAVSEHLANMYHNSNYETQKEIIKELNARLSMGKTESN